MRSKVLLLAIGLLVADSALASPYKPRSSTSETAISTSVGSTTQPTSTVEETPTVASSETSTETGAITMTAPDTTAASEAETTTAVESTTTTAEAESTTTTAVALYKARPSQASTKMVASCYSTLKLELAVPGRSSSTPTPADCGIKIREFRYAHTAALQTRSLTLPTLHSARMVTLGPTRPLITWPAKSSAASSLVLRPKLRAQQMTTAYP
ncbi:hypothetical protein BFJ70_g5084 [Fusarium oxysporum]|uniref:Uncharacterized protein n=1 Tax=Fusarium oxysporum f. sp. cepae TaxID=396571 RepID=A0A3L6N4X8_FUSOX|nr:hypothetical protein BFJ65_g13892 [Fusarium oxysporum f. sp. cepae]RKK55496.1 hypothetical protein BFJ67_g4277 [Fusarium oxysporum f. sp. cepae]RKK57160.1 hypothetical protein BFJ66_g3269 [Fusarium oxysporum f. sp. cepae]RKL42343.1 hypothetical protein BFJ70_g5084 [Fusarium oxysporum]